MFSIPELRKYLVPMSIAFLLGVAGCFIVADAHQPTPKEDGGIAQRVQRIEERLDALQEVTHNMIGKNRLP